MSARQQLRDRREPGAGSGGALRIWRPAELSGIEALLGQGSPRPQPTHFHDEYELVVFLAPPGTEQVRHRGGVHPASPGELVLVAPGEVHATEVRARSEVTCRILQCSATTVGAVAGDVSDGAPLALPDFASIALSGAGLVEEFLALHRSIEQSGEPLEQEARLLAFWARLLRHHAVKPPALPRLRRERGVVRRVQRFMREQLTRRMSLAELAGVAGMSRFHFCRVFQQETGMTPAAYHAHLRMLRARELLRRGEPIAQVALEVGLVDQSHLNRLFLRAMGITPGRYVAAVRPQLTSR